MVERLTHAGRVVPLPRGTRTPRCTSAGVLVLETPAGGVEALADLVAGPAVAGAALPAAGGRGPRAPGQPGVGGRPGLRPRLPRPPVRRCPGRAPRRSCCDLVSRLTSRPLDRRRPLWEAVPRRGARGRPGRGRHQDPPGPGRRAQRHRHRAGAARRRAGRARAGAGGVAPAARPRAAPSWSGRRSTSTCAGPRRSWTRRAGAVDDVRSTAARARRRRRWAARAPRGRRSCPRRTARSTRRSAGSAGWPWPARSSTT